MKQIFEICARITAAALMGLLLFCSIETQRSPSGNNQKTAVSFSLEIPHAAHPASRSLSPADEGHVATVDVLVFAGGQYRFTQAGYNITTISDSKKTFEVILPLGTYDLTIIANGRNAIQAAHFQLGDLKENVLYALEHALPAGTKWTSNEIPIWGQRNGVTIDQNTSFTGSNSFKLTRMISKIEVALEAAAAGVNNTNFAITSVRLYNYNTAGKLVPNLATGWDEVNNKVTTPHLAASPGKTLGPLVYTSADDPTGLYFTPGSVTNTIYTFEANAGSAAQRLTTTCIVVGGSYQGSGPETHFYRMDFAKTENQTTSYLPLLRNHRYGFKVRSITGPGFPTPEEAFTAGPVNIEANVIEWNEGDITQIVFDDQYILGVSHSRFELSNNAHTILSTDNILKVFTDYPTGWTATVSTNNWLTINPTQGPVSGQMYDMHLLAGANTGAERTACIYIKAGRLTYMVTVVQLPAAPGIITVTPNEWLLPHTIPSNANYNLTISCKKSDGTNDPNAPWTLTSADPSWCRLSASPSTPFSNANTSISGAGPGTLYLIAANNTSMSPRTTVIYKDALPSNVVTNVIQWGNPGTITDNEGGGTPPVDATTYVGAFWRANEKGERIIRINLSANSANWGTWSATVMWMDGRWGSGEGVILDTNMLDNTSLSNRGISFTSASNPDAYGTPEDYPVTGYQTTVSGQVVNGYISFRIGLKSLYTPVAGHPARYAVILLSYANTSKHQKIFLRQGEGADYLMTNSDPVSTGGLSARTKCKPFLPYNLTADNLDSQVAINGGKLTLYPTQSGAFFQWTNVSIYNSRTRWAWNPYTTSAASGWSDWSSSSDWSVLSATHETCPAGYRRPNDGAITGDEPCTNISNSELRQSLLLKPKTGYNYASEITNSLWGYYADGFFDRRQLVNGSGSQAVSTTVSSGSRDIAHIGRLFFNPVASSDHYNASLFFPAAGLRFYSNGDYYGSGNESTFWSASKSDVFSLAFIVRNDHAGPWRAERGNGYPIRCVKE